MLANYLIGLREGLEAALVVGILVAYLVKTGRRDRLGPIWLGVGAGALASLAAGALLTFTSRSMSFRAQETFGGVMSIVAVAFVTWMVFWMRRTARHLKGELHSKLDAALRMGTGALAVTALVAVGREGLETALFIWTAVKATGNSAAPIAGAVGGLTTAVVLGYLLYKRSVALNLARFFTFTGVALVVVAAGVLAYGIHDLQEAGLLVGWGLGRIAFDATGVLPPASWYGSLVKGLLSISAAPTRLEVAVWIAYLVPVMTLFVRRPRRRPTSSGRRPSSHQDTPPTPTTPPVTARPTAVSMTRVSRLGAGTGLGLLIVGLGACSSSEGGGPTVAVTSTATACEVGQTQLTAGRYTFAVDNKGTDVTEVYIYAGDKIVTEKEHIGPGTQATFHVNLKAGSYEVACKPGEKGDGIRQKLTVT